MKLRFKQSVKEPYFEKRSQQTVIVIAIRSNSDNSNDDNDKDSLHQTRASFVATARARALERELYD